MSFAKFAVAVFLTLVGSATIPSTWAQTFTMLYSFTGGTDGAFPEGGVILDSSGNLYGTSTGAGQAGLEGSVFKLSPKGKFTLLHSFGTGGAGGDEPTGNLVRTSDGDLYGTTLAGGSGSGYGIVFQLDKKDNFSVFYNFNGTDGAQPSGLTIDAAGNLYGAAGGGSYTCDGADHVGCGVVYRLDPSGNETVLHAFKDGRKGSLPDAGLLLDTAGNLYGTTHGSFNPYSTVVFELDAAGSETVLYTFKWDNPNGPAPNRNLIQDTVGNFYGTTRFGGLQTGICKSFGPCGLVFKVDPNGNETVLYAFTGGADGFSPRGGLVMDAAGNLYGTTAAGGTFNDNCALGCGVVFKLDPSSNLTVLHSFAGADGDAPLTGLTMDAAGNLYGTTIRGGNLNDCPNGNFNGCGVVFKITSK
jgi:uncharacterized repeat protein (TIGR03803 family)